MINNRANLKHLNSLQTRLDKLLYMTGGNVTVQKLTQVIDNKFVHSYNPKIRGILVGSTRYPTPEEARTAGHKIHNEWIKELKRTERARR